jgi:hypothetical protein
MELGKSTGDWVTSAVWLCRALILQEDIGVPAKVSEGWGAWRGSVGGWRPRRRDAIVDLPDPDGPTTAVQEPAWKVIETPWRILTVGWEG